MNFNVFAPKYQISAQFGYNFSRQTDSGAGIACFCHSLVTSLYDNNAEWIIMLNVTLLRKVLYSTGKNCHQGFVTRL